MNIKNIILQSILMQDHQVNQHHFAIQIQNSYLVRQMIQKDYIQKLLEEKYEKDFSNMRIVKNKWKVSKSTQPYFISNVVYVQQTFGSTQIFQYFSLHELGEPIKTIHQSMYWNAENQLILHIQFSPNNRFVYLATRQSIKKYGLQAKKEGQYFLNDTAIADITIPENVIIIEMIGSPSGEFLIASGKKSEPQETYLIKISDKAPTQILKTTDYQCIQVDENQGGIDFDKRTQNYFVTVFQKHICYWDGDKLELKSIKQMSEPFIYYSQKLLFENSPQFTNVKVLSHPNVVTVVDFKNKCSHLFVWTGSQIDYLSTITFSTTFDPNKIDFQILELPELDSFGIFQPDSSKLEFVKLLQEKQTSKAIFVMNTQKRIKEVFYHHHNHTLCFIADFTLNCSNIYIEMPPDLLIDLHSSVQCSNTSQFWNSKDWVCTVCNQTCSCLQPYQQTSMVSGQCQFNCEAIKNAIHYSEYMRNGSMSCSCSSNFEWSSESNQCLMPCKDCQCSLGFIFNPDLGCVVDCSQVQNTINPTSNSKCQCKKGFEYIEVGQNKIGRCETICQSETHAHWKNGQPYCECQSGYEWSNQKEACLSSSSSNNSQIITPIIIVVCCVILFVVIFVCLFRRLKRNKKESESNSAQGTDEIISTPDSNRASLEKYCSICTKGGINCQGPCGHLYHFNCIKEIIEKDENNAKCPSCSYSLEHGVLDLNMRSFDCKFSVEDDI